MFSVEFNPKSLYLNCDDVDLVLTHVLMLVRVGVDGKLLVTVPNFVVGEIFVERE